MSNLSTCCPAILTDEDTELGKSAYESIEQDDKTLKGCFLIYFGLLKLYIIACGFFHDLQRDCFGTTSPAPP